jgi:hypothetical protein
VDEKSPVCGQAKGILQRQHEASNLTFEAYVTQYNYQYTTVVIRIYALDVQTVPVGYIRIKSVSIQKCTKTIANGHAEVAKHLSIFANDLTADDRLPVRMISLNIDCEMASLSLEDSLMTMMEDVFPAPCAELNINCEMASLSLEDSLMTMMEDVFPTPFAELNNPGRTMLASKEVKTVTFKHGE